MKKNIISIKSITYLKKFTGWPNLIYNHVLTKRDAKQMKCFGICIGAINVHCVILNRSATGDIVQLTKRIPHAGDPKKVILKFLSSAEISNVDKVAITGRSFRKTIALSSISETQATEYALKHTYSRGDFPNLVISCGGETQLVYQLDQQGNVLSAHTGNKCASGTGEFFIQQIGRMNLNPDQAVKLAISNKPYKIAGRCSVFCKSDCTHALNKGEPKGSVVAGLCAMMSDKVISLIKNMPAKKSLLIGGGSLNQALIKNLRDRLPHVDVPLYASIFEAYGAALWAADHSCIALPENIADIFKNVGHSFEVFPPIYKAKAFVTFQKNQRTGLKIKNSYILGLDIGSTTTKAALVDKESKKIAASAYLRTNGNPIEASKACYRIINKQINNLDIQITGIGFTGSGRQIAALHALSDFVVNEISAHATAASYFDQDVDTIFEIGGQDAKYTYLTKGVPSDYAMNEACSAGTGSFLEESAKESLHVTTEMIGDLALTGDSPPNFADQCAAFISSDIKRASQENITKENILAGLVYSICLNYLNRVKKSRPVGKKIFMQGGVCYNKAVPIAMASLMQTPIIVPPDPGLMGAFGVALEVINQQKFTSTTEKNTIDLQSLINRNATVIDKFICKGGKNHCDRKCSIARIEINGKKYPFGGACDLYYNQRLKKSHPYSNEINYVAIRQQLLFQKYLAAKPHTPKRNKTIGIVRSFLTHDLAPLYTNFFASLGFDIVVSDKIDPEGISRIEAAFCFPAEISHGAFFNLLKKNLDYIFLPHILEMPYIGTAKPLSKTCVFVQGEPYYLKTTFQKEIKTSKTQILSPILNMRKGFKTAENELVKLAVGMGVDKKISIQAFKYACEKQNAYVDDLRAYGKKALRYLDDHPETFGIVFLGRSYNTFAEEANMGIPNKVVSRNTIVIPLDMLPLHEQEIDNDMYWTSGQKIMQAANMIKQRKNLFGFYVTNFSCGPDSFLLGYFRNCMGNKPSLTLELDQHTADAGIDTRIEAALSIMKTYYNMSKRKAIVQKTCDNFVPAQITYNKKPIIIASNGSRYSLKDPHVELVFPSMGKLNTELVAAVFRGSGINAKALPIPDSNMLLEGKKNSTSKECLPYMVTTGSFLSYLKTKKDPSKVTLLFMTTGGGPCRFGQYRKALKQVIINNKIPNVAILSLTDQNGYSGLGVKLLLRTWQSVIVSEVFNDVYNMLAIIAKDKQKAKEEIDQIFNMEIIPFFEGKSSLNINKFLEKIAIRISKIPVIKDKKTVPVISLVGEIFVRNEEFSRGSIIEYLQDQGFMVKLTPVGEYMSYANHVIANGFDEGGLSLKKYLKIKVSIKIKDFWERRIKSILSKSGCYNFEMIDVDKTINVAKPFINENLRGEAILTVGLALRDILHNSCGVISVGPFGCMPSRVAESILKKEMNIVSKQRACNWKSNKYKDLSVLPFLALETDGNPYPQIIEANLEAFTLQAKRVHKIMMKSN